MKKSILGTFAAIALISMSLTSCGGGKTPEQIDAEAKTAIEKAKSEWQTAADDACTKATDGYKTAALDSMKAAAAPVVAPQ
jgi:predicted small lipoprotein YifL